MTRTRGSKKHCGSIIHDGVKAIINSSIHNDNVARYQEQPNNFTGYVTWITPAATSVRLVDEGSR